MSESLFPALPILCFASALVVWFVVLVRVARKEDRWNRNNKQRELETADRDVAVRERAVAVQEENNRLLAELAEAVRSRRL